MSTWSWIWAAGWWSSTTSVTAILPATPSFSVPEARIAWAGNLIVGEGSIPFLIEGGAGAYLETMAKFTHTLEVGTIILRRLRIFGQRDKLKADRSKGA
jgi:hypothetical protein